MNWRVRHNGVQRQLSSSLAETREAYLVILADLLNGKDLAPPPPLPRLTS
jgi:hypothetical protein